MRIKLLLLTCPLAAALAGCDGEVSDMFTSKEERAAGASVEADGGPDATKLTITGPDGETITQETGADVPVDLPKGFNVYPGAKVVSNTVMRQGDMPGSMIMLQSDDEPAKIVAYYKKQAEDAGLEIELEADMGVSQMLSAQGEDGTTLTASASRNEGDSKTTAQLIVAVSKSE